MKKNKNLPDKIPVFPLSNFIIFPNTSVPLNIFEPRYIEMINDCMKSNRIIGMIQPRNKKKIEPELYSIGCAGKIVSFDETDDGRYLIVIKGISRFKIIKEIINNKTYRECEVNFEQFKNDLNKKENEVGFNDLKIIFKSFKSLFEKNGYQINWKEIEKQSLDQTINTLAMASPFSLEEKQILLEAIDINNRKVELEKILNTYTLDQFNHTTLQ